MMYRPLSDFNALVVSLCVLVATFDSGAPQPSAQQAAPAAVILTRDNAPLQSGKTVIARVRRGERLSVVHTQGNWYRVRGVSGGRAVQGWIHQQHVRVQLPETPKNANNMSHQVDRGRLAAQGRALNNQVVQLMKKAKYKQALPLARQAMAIRRQALGSKLLRSMGDYRAARPYYEQALSIHKAVFGEKHSHTATSLDSLGHLLKSTGDYEAARPYFQQALSIRKEVLGEKHPVTATSLDNLVVCPD